MKYFSFANVKQGVFSIAEELFDIKILAIPKAATWHEDVTFYEVRSQNKVLGQFYLDLHPRKNKYKHAAQFTLRQGIRGFNYLSQSWYATFLRPQTVIQALWNTHRSKPSCMSLAIYFILSSEDTMSGLRLLSGTLSKCQLSC